jgi:CRP-like cAMP-binding protein
MQHCTTQTRACAADGATSIEYEAAHDRQLAHRPLHAAMLRAIDKLSLLQIVSIFDQLTPTELTFLAEHLGAQAFGRGQTIFHQGDRGDTLYLIARGQIRIYHPSATGRELSVVIFRAGDFFGELALLDDRPRSASAEAMLPTVALTLDRATFRKTIQDQPMIAEALLAVLAARLRDSTSYAEYLAASSAHQRVGLLVLDLARRYGVQVVGGTRIDLHLSQDDLASMFGMTRETVNRVLARLRKQGLVAIDHGQLLVPDCARLERALL